MNALLITLICGAGPAEELAACDALAAAARTCDEKARADAVARALDGYAAFLGAHDKDPELVPRVRRRRASLLSFACRPLEALAEHDAILAGPSSRRDRARALLDGAQLLARGKDFAAAEQRAARVEAEFGDETEICGQASLARGRWLEGLHREKEAETCYRSVVDRCGDEPKLSIAAYDALALLALSGGEVGQARHWLKTCTERFEKRAAKGDRFGTFLSRLLGEMKAPAALAKAQTAPPAKEGGAAGGSG